MSNLPVITLIGAGNMAKALIGGLIKHGHPSDKLWAASPHRQELIQLQQEFPIHTTTNNNEATLAADVVILAVKPQIFSTVLQEIAATLKIRKPIIISIAAGIRIASMMLYLNNELTIIRAMPNLPAVIGYGATALYTANELIPSEKRLIEHILLAVGVVKWLANEELMDSITALSGSGPAYFFLIFEALEKAGEALGLPVDVAHLFTLQTALGAAQMAIKTNTSLTTLRQQVTSKGGTTEKAISVLEESNIQSLLKLAVLAAKQRAEELADQLGE